MLIVDHCVLYTLCVLGTFVLDYDLFVRQRKVTRVRKYQYTSAHLLVYFLVL